MSRDLEQFKKIYFDEFKEHLSEDDVERISRAVVNLYLAVYRSPADIVKETPLNETNHE